jgi:hypothetical protein
MAKKALHDKKPHHVRIRTAERTRFEKQYICTMGEVQIKFIFSYWVMQAKEYNRNWPTCWFLFLSTVLFIK